MAALNSRVYAVLGRFFPNLDLPEPPTALSVADALRGLSDLLNSIAELTPQATDVAPATPREGMVRLAVAPWLPLGGSDPRFVGYKDGAWVALD